MKIDLIISVDDIKKEKIIGKTVIVIDMLRATSVIITAIDNGCEKVIPVLTIEEALDLSKVNRENFVLGGERKAVKIEEFDCSNSPLEFTKEVLKNKTLIMSTTNGTRAIHGCIGAKHILIGAIINAKAVAKKIIELGEDVVIVNAGTYGQFSMDDFICSGFIIDRILTESKAELTDITKTALYIYNSNKDIMSFLKLATHYNTLEKLGLLEDLKYCSQKDIIDIVPEYKDGIIT